MLAAAVETVLDRKRDLRERGIECLLYRLAKTAFVDNYLDLMRQILDRPQELEARCSRVRRMPRRIARSRGCAES
jgi:hypothetical protein